MGFWGTLGKIGMAAAPIIAAPFTAGTSLSFLPAALGAGGAALGAIGQGRAQNRGEQFGGQMDLAQLLMSRDVNQAHLEGQADRDFFSQNLQREQEGREGRKDAFSGLMRASRVLNPGAKPQLSPYSVKPREFSDMERQGADAMSAEVMARLQGGNPIAAPTRRGVNIAAPNVDPRLLEPGMMEKILEWLGPSMTAGGAIAGAIGNRQSPLPGMPTPPPVSTGYR